LGFLALCTGCPPKRPSNVTGGDAMTTSLAEYHKMLRRLTTTTDVLVQLSENYYLMSRLRDQRVEEAGGRSFNLLRHAVGLELASRIYRLLDKDTTNHGLGGFFNRLEEPALMRLLLPAFNHDGFKSLDDLIAVRDGAEAMRRKLTRSSAYQRINVFRQRFTGHMNPSPRMLNNMTPAQRERHDVEVMHTKDVRDVIRGISAVLDKLSYMNGRNEFNPKIIADMAADDARELWGLPPLPSRTPSFLLPTGRGRDIPKGKT
jgi:hypothetical protein